MNILYISSANKLGGGATHALINIISAIQGNNGYQCFVMYPKGSDELADLLSSNGCKCFPSHIGLTIWPTCSFKRTPILWLKSLIKSLFTWSMGKKECRRIIKNYQIDLVHTNVGPMNYALPICQKFGIPHVWHLREFQELIGMKMFPYPKYFFVKIKQTGNYNIAITKSVFENYGLRKKDTVIYDGVFPYKVAAETRQLSKKNIVLVAGVVSPSKGILDLINAFGRFHRIHPSFILQIAGRYSNDVYYQNCVQAIERHDLGLCVEFLGQRGDIYDLMSKSKIVVVSSPFEGFGFTIVEGMLNYCVVIGRNTTGVKEQFDNGLIQTGQEIGLRYNTEDELVKCLCQAVEQDHSEMIQRARKVVVENYTNEKSSSQLLSYYNFVINDFYGNKNICL